MATTKVYNGNIFSEINTSGHLDVSLIENRKKIIREIFCEKLPFDKIYVELEFENYEITLNKFLNESLVSFEVKKFKTDFIIEKVIFCDFSYDDFSFCAFGNSKITHFHQKVGYTSRILPFKIKDIYFVKNKISGLIFISFTPYLNNSLFWLSNSFNDLFPLPLQLDSSLINISIDKILFIDFNNSLIIFSNFNGVFKPCQVVLKQIPLPPANSDLSLSAHTHNSSISQELSYLNLSKHEQIKLDSFNSNNNSSIFFRAIDFTNENSMNLSLVNSRYRSESRYSSGIEKIFILQRDPDINFSIKLTSKTKIIKSLIFQDFSDRKFLALLTSSGTLELFLLNSTSIASSLKSLDKIIDFVFLPETKLFITVDVNHNMIVYSGDVNIYTIFNTTTVDFKIISSRFDKIIFSSGEKVFIAKFFILSQCNHMIDRFWKLLRLQNPLEAKFLYDNFLTFVFEHFNNKNINECFSRFLFSYFGVPFKDIHVVKKSVQRLLVSMKPPVRVCKNDQISLDAIPCDKKSFYKFLLQFIENFIIKFSYDEMNIKILENVIDSTFVYFSELKLTISQSKENQNINMEASNVSERNHMSFLAKLNSPIYNENFSTLCLSDVKHLMSSPDSKTLFPFNQIDSDLNPNILQKTRGILDWSQETVDHCFSTDIFGQKSNIAGDDGNSTDDPIISQKSYASLQMTRILSKPFGLACCNFGMGIRGFCDFSFQTLNNPLNPQIKFSIFQDNDYAFPVVVKLDEQDFTPAVLEQAQFHNGVCMALTSIKSISPETVRSRFISNASGTQITSETTEAWLKQTVDCFGPSDFGGFIYGCGLIGQLYNIPIDSPGFLLNILLKSTGMSLCGILLGLGISHIKSYKLDSAVLVRRLQRIFFIHSGLSPFTADANQNHTMSTVREIFHFDNTESKINIEVQASALLSLGFLHFTSGDCLILRIMKTYFNSIMDQAYSIPSVTHGLKGFISNPRMAYNQKIISSILAICIGMINLKRRQKNEFTWENFYGNLIRRLSDSSNTMSQFLESVYIMIGLTYLRTNHENASKLLETPLEWIQKTHVKPSLLIISNWFFSLIMEKDLFPTYRSIYKNLPQIVRKTINIKSCEITEEEQDSTYNSWAVITGRLYALCLKYAGTFNKRCFAILMRYIKKLRNIMKNCVQGEEHPHSVQIQIYGQCLSILILGISIVFAGSCLATIKILIQKVLNSYKPKYYFAERNNINAPNYYLSHLGGDHRYGFSMALHTALGILCLGNGYMSLTTEKLESYCMLVISMYPNFPSSPTDNITYFQPLRHLYTLACTRSRIAVLIDKYNYNLNNQCFKLKYHTNKNKIKEKKLRFKSPQAIILPYSFDYIEIEFSYYEKVILKSSMLEPSNKSRLFDLGQLHKIHLKLIQKEYVPQLSHISYSFNRNSFINFLRDAIKIDIEYSTSSRHLLFKYKGAVPINLINTLLDIILVKSLTHENIRNVLTNIRLSTDRLLCIKGEDSRESDTDNLTRKHIQLIHECFSYLNNK